MRAVADDNTVYRAIKYRVYPTDAQSEKLSQTFGCARKVYNDALSMQRGLYEAGMPTFGQTALNAYCNRVWKDEFPFLTEVDKFALTNSLYALCAAYKNFFEGRTGYPRYKSRRGEEQSYTTNYTNGNIEVITRKGNRGFVKIPKVGKVPASIHRVPKKDWVLKSATVSKQVNGKYYIAVLYQLPDTLIKQAPLPTEETTLGLDYSSPKFYVDSNGNDAGVMHWYRKSEERLAKEQRKLSHCKKGSNRYFKQKARVSKLSRTVANQRLDFCHKLSRKIASSYDAVCVEDIDLSAMAQTLKFGKAVSDNGFGMFRTFLQYKLAEQGKYYIVIDKWYPSTKTCWHCGSKNPDVQLGQMEWVCPHCGAVIDRDLNAAINIRNEGLRTFYAERIPA